MIKRGVRLLGVASLVLAAGLGFAATQSLRDQNERLLQRIGTVHRLSDSEMRAVRAVFASSPYIGQGNPTVSKHPATPAQCEARLEQRGVSFQNPQFEAICGDTRAFSQQSHSGAQ